MSPSRLAVLLILLLAAPAASAEVYQWVDQQGRVHYGDRPAPGVPATPREELSVPEPAQADRDAAAERAARDRARLQSLPPSPPPEPTGTEGDRSPPQAEAEDDSCAAQHRRYRASQACFAPYVTVTGAVKPEAFQYCENLPQPQCEE